jgi:hypothetical protein
MTVTLEQPPRTRDRQFTAGSGRDKVGGVAALYLALALVAAIPYFLLVVDYPSATTASDKVALVVENYASMYVVYVATYMLFGLALGVLSLAMYDHLERQAPVAVRLATAVGLLWSFVLVASGLVFTYGMTTVVDVHDTDPTQAVQTWRGVEPVAMALGGAGGELLGGLWVLMLSLVVLRTGGLPRVVAWLGVMIGSAGLLSVAPPVQDAAVVFGLLQIVWFLCVGWCLLKERHREARL